MRIVSICKLLLLILTFCFVSSVQAQTPPHVVNVRYDITVGPTSLEVYEALEIGSFPNVTPYWINAQVNTTAQTCNVIDLDQMYDLGQATSVHCGGSGDAFKAFYMKWDAGSSQLIPFVLRIECADVNAVYFTTANENYVYGSGTYTLVPFGIFQPFPSYC